MHHGVATLFDMAGFSKDPEGGGEKFRKRVSFQYLPEEGSHRAFGLGPTETMGLLA